MNKPIERAIAKEEIERINEISETNLLLIGGLAVQQYCPSRDSKDIDLVCDFDLARKILADLYPTKDWKIYEPNYDDYRPSYRIKHKFEDKGTIIFGPKIIEREGYDYIDWDYLKDNSRPFSARQGRPLEKILIPSAEALAYTKLISYLFRTGNDVKITQDLKDFVDLTNYDDFSSSRFYDLIRRSKAEEFIFKNFRKKSSTHIDRIAESSLYALLPLFFLEEKPIPSLRGKKATKKSNISVYIAAPHMNITRNKIIGDAAKSVGANSLIPYEEVSSKNLEEGVGDSIKIRDVCKNAIESSEILVVDLDKYGLDTAWEVGYAEGLGMHVIGYNEDEGATTNKRFINRRTYIDNFMHGWQSQSVFSDLSELANQCQDKSVYICGSFSNNGIVDIENSPINKLSKKVIYPMKYIEVQGKLPSDYPISERAETNKLLESVDVVVVMLPRYGMDVSWQIGYATALGKEIIGILLTDDKKELGKASFWDHWMHSWKSKLRATGISELRVILKGLIN